MLLRVARQLLKTLVRNHVTCSLCDLPYATRELDFLRVVSAEAVSVTASRSDHHQPNPCGGGVEYLHRDPISRTRQRKGTLKLRQ
jgi:hypothetical protein